MVRTKSPGASSPTSRAATPSAVRERRPPGPRGHGGGQAGRRLAGARHVVHLLDGPDPLGQDRQGVAAPGQLGAALVAQPVLQGSPPLLPPRARAGPGRAGPGAVRTRPPRGPRPARRARRRPGPRRRGPRRSGDRPRGRCGTAGGPPASAPTRRGSPSAPGRRPDGPAAARARSGLRACHWAKERCSTASAVSRSNRETRLTARL